MRQQQKRVRGRFDDLEAVITQIEQRLSSQRAIDAITQNVEYSAVSSALTEILPQLIKQFSPLRQQLKKVLPHSTKYLQQLSHYHNALIYKNYRYNC